MRNILTLWRHDLRLATRNVIAIIVLFGVCVIPSFFAWFNVLSSWDPFGNVKNMKIAVANADVGFESELFPMRVNIGQQVVASLRANTDLNWVFTSEAEAIEGTKSEEYYAALVLPPSFSEDMMSFLAPGAKPTQIDYYINEKTNALSPKIAGEAASDVSSQINSSFTKTLNEVGLSLVSSLADRLEDPAVRAALDKFESTLNAGAKQLRANADTARMFSALFASSKPLVNSAASLTNSSIDALDQTTGAIADGRRSVNSLASTLERGTASLSSALSSSAGSYQELSTSVDKLYASLGKQTDDTRVILDDIADRVDGQITSYTSLRDRVQQQADDVSEAAEAAPELEQPALERLAGALQLVADRLTDAIDRQTELRDRLQESSADLGKGLSGSKAARKEVKSLIAESRAAIEDVEKAYRDNLRPKLNRLGASLSSVNSGLATIGNDYKDAASTLSGGTGSVLGALTIAQQLTETMAGNLDSAADKFDKVAASLKQAQNSGDVGEVKDLIAGDPARLAAELAAPVGLKTIPVFEVSTFGAQMAPFYTVLGLWVGALLLSVLIRTNIDRGLLPQLTRPLTRTQEYVGRYGIFALLGFIQSSLLYLGLIGFVGVTPVHPFLLVLAGWVMSTVFTLITYTLVLSFGEAGKALGVVLLVFQISAGGGAYPLAVLPEWFQKISPFLPVSHATNAVRSAIAGIYQGDYWTDLGELALFIVPTLLLGLLLRLPLTKVNEDLDQALESTKLM